MVRVSADRECVMLLYGMRGTSRARRGGVVCCIVDGG